MNLNVGGKLKTFMENSKHILSVSYRPGRSEFSKTARIIIVGILAVGMLGFVISLIIGYITGS
jgi:protein translocase SEC61 complex gamma subunit